MSTSHVSRVDRVRCRLKLAYGCLRDGYSPPGSSQSLLLSKSIYHTYCHILAPNPLSIVTIGSSSGPKPVNKSDTSLTTIRPRQSQMVHPYSRLTCDRPSTASGA